MLPSESFFVLKTHLNPTAFTPSGNSTRSHTRLDSTEFISSFMALYHELDSLNLMACENVSGSFSVTPQFPGGSLTTRQPAEYSWMSSNTTPLTKIGQSLLCMGSSTQSITCPNILQRPHKVHVRVKMATWAHASILTKYISTI